MSPMRVVIIPEAQERESTLSRLPDSEVLDNRELVQAVECSPTREGTGF